MFVSFFKEDSSSVLTETWIFFAFNIEKCKVGLTLHKIYSIICKVSFTKPGILSGLYRSCMKNKLEELREVHGFTQQDLADRLEVSRQTIISLEQGRYNPSIMLAFRAARLFKLSIEEIFIYEEGETNG
jgi:putative transcriptional regulator